MKQIIDDILGDSSFPKGIAWEKKSFETGETIVHENDFAESLFFIKEGALQVKIKLTNNDNELTQNQIFLLKPGDIFGEASLCQTGTRSATVIADSNGSLVEIDGERLSIYLDAHPIQGYLFYKQLFGIQLSRVNNANLQIEKLISLTNFIKS